MMLTDKVKKLVPSNSFMLIDNNCSNEKVFAPVRQVRRNLDGFFGDIVY